MILKIFPRGALLCKANLKLMKLYFKNFVGVAEFGPWISHRVTHDKREEDGNRTFWGWSRLQTLPNPCRFSYSHSVTKKLSMVRTTV